MLHFSVAMISIITLFVYDKNYLKPLAIGYSISLLGFLCLAFQGTGIPFVTIVLGNTFVMLGTILVGHGLLRIINKSVPINIGIGIVAIHFITFCYFTFMHPSMPVRVIIMSLEAMLVTGYIGILFGAQFLTKPHIITALMSCIHLLYMPVLVIRIINVINVSPYVWILNDHNYALIQFWTIIITFSVLFLQCFSLQMILKKSLQRKTTFCTNSLIQTRLLGFIMSDPCLKNLNLSAQELRGITQLLVLLSLTLIILSRSTTPTDIYLATKFFKLLQKYVFMSSVQ